MSDVFTTTMDEDFIAYQKACGPLLPNWLYFHCPESKDRLLLVKRGP
jgi:hypothetical protein